MNRLNKLFQNKENNLLSVYFTAGFPELDSTGDVIDALCRGDVDMIEVGIPFSDPMADGPVIQNSGTVALRNGMTLRTLLSQVEDARKRNPDVPFIAMGYLNPIMQMGAENFFKRAKEAGIDAVIIPDLPFDTYMSEYKELSRKYDIPMIMLITPETSEERIHQIDDNCDGFIYMVSAASTTGARDRFTEEQIDYFKRINNLDLKHSRLIGFGISNAVTFDEACRYSSGAIIGSQFIKCLDANPTPEAAVKDLMTRIGRI
ncbi:MAG: tryptophan synthase subunit alpha [Muribaculaceae bacterium]|nr:tryptophan synthase subunit alpha [Muribaculaceae bacterium]